MSTGDLTRIQPATDGPPLVRTVGRVSSGDGRRRTKGSTGLASGGARAGHVNAGSAGDATAPGSGRGPTTTGTGGHAGHGRGERGGRDDGCLSDVYTIWYDTRVGYLCEAVESRTEREIDRKGTGLPCPLLLRWTRLHARSPRLDVRTTTFGRTHPRLVVVQLAFTKTVRVRGGGRRASRGRRNRGTGHHRVAWRARLPSVVASSHSSVADSARPHTTHE